MLSHKYAVRLCLPALLTAVLVSGGCSDKKKIVSGDEFPFRPVAAQFVDTTFAAAEVVTFEADPPRGDAQLKMALGTYEDKGVSYSANILMKWIPITGTSQNDSIYLDAYLRMGSDFFWGQPAPGQMATLHKVNFSKPWDETVNSSMRSVEWDPAPFDTLFVGTDSVSVDSIQIPKSVLQEWLAGSAGNAGFLIDGSRLSFMREYYSRESGVDQTFIGYKVIIAGGDTLTRRSRMVADASVVTQNVTLPAQRHMLDAQKIYRTALRFNLSDIPKTATINRAILRVGLEDGASNRRRLGAGNNYIQEVVAGFRVTVDDLSAIGDEGYQSTSVLSGYAFDNEILMNVTSLVQFWTAQNGPNQGVMLRLATEGQDLTRLHLYTAESAPVDSLKPRLDVEYYTSSTDTF